MTKLVLFDIDGTLLLTDGAGLRAMARAAGEIFGEGFVFDGVKPAGGLDPLLFGEAARLSGIPVGPAEHAAFRDRYVRYLEDELARRSHRIRLMPGARDAVEALSLREDFVLGVLTGNYRGSAELKLRAADYPREWFRVGVFGDEAGSRSGLLRLAMERYRELTGVGLDAWDVVIVGDTPRDVESALDVGSRIFAVATGPYSVEDLSASGAHVAVEDLSDPTPLYRFLGLGPEA